MVNIQIERGQEEKKALQDKGMSNNILHRAYGYRMSKFYVGNMNMNMN